LTSAARYAWFARRSRAVTGIKPVTKRCRAAQRVAWGKGVQPAAQPIVPGPSRVDGLLGGAANRWTPQRSEARQRADRFGGGMAPAPRAARGHRSRVKQSADRRRQPESATRPAGQSEYDARAQRGAPAVGSTGFVQKPEPPATRPVWRKGGGAPAARAASPPLFAPRRTGNRTAFGRYTGYRHHGEI